MSLLPYIVVGFLALNSTSYCVEHQHDHNDGVVIMMLVQREDPNRFFVNLAIPPKSKLLGNVIVMQFWRDKDEGRILATKCQRPFNKTNLVDSLFPKQGFYTVEAVLDVDYDKAKKLKKIEKDPIENDPFGNGDKAFSGVFVVDKPGKYKISFGLLKNGKIIPVAECSLARTGGGLGDGIVFLGMSVRKEFSPKMNNSTKEP